MIKRNHEGGTERQRETERDRERRRETETERYNKIARKRDVIR